MSDFQPKSMNGQLNSDSLNSFMLLPQIQNGPNIFTSSVAQKHLLSIINKFKTTCPQKAPSGRAPCVPPTHTALAQRSNTFWSLITVVLICILYISHKRRGERTTIHWYSSFWKSPRAHWQNYHKQMCQGIWREIASRLALKTTKTIFHHYHIFRQTPQSKLSHIPNTQNRAGKMALWTNIFQF